MNTLIRALAFVFFFCADVTVHASDHGGGHEAKPEAAHSVKHAAKELGDGPFLAEKREVVSLSGGQLVMSRGSLVRREESGPLQLIRGEFLYEGPQAADFKTPFATFSCGGGDCRFLVKRLADKIEIKNLQGNMVIKRNGENQPYLLPTCTQVVVSTVTAKGFADMEFPQSLPWADTAREWAALYPGDMKELRQLLSDFRQEWKQAVEAVSALHSERAGREIASAQRVVDEAEDRAAAREREDAKLRELFRKNTFDK